MLRFIAVLSGVQQAAGVVEHVYGHDEEFNIDNSGLSLLQLRVDSGPRKEVAALAAPSAVADDSGTAPRDRFAPFGQGEVDSDFNGILSLTLSQSEVTPRSSPGAPSRHGEDKLWHPHSLERLLIVPKHKLMVCLTDTSPIGQLLNTLNGKYVKDMLGSSAIASFGWTEAQTRLALEGNDWYKAVFLRDPLERLLLAFLRECEGARGESTAAGNGSACLFFEDRFGDHGRGAKPEFADFTRHLQKGFERFPQRFTGIDRETLLNASGPAPASRSGRGKNPHFTPQSQFCGGLNASHYDFVADVGRDMHHQLGEVLATVGATGHESLLGHLFSPSTFGVQASSALNRTEYQQQYANVDTILDARRIYDKDYRFLESAAARQPKPAQVCINTIFALDFEKRRILDWVAYHSLMGVDCFYLFHDTRRSNMSDPEVGDVLHQLLNSPNVTVFTAHTLRDRGRLANTEEWFKYFPARYLLIIDVDEFVVLDGSQTNSANNSIPLSLFEYLEAMDLVGQGAAGVYLNRWDYGTGGHVKPPSVATEPEFGLLTERWGAMDRGTPQKALGKLILNMHAGFPKYLSVHRWNPKGGGHMLFPNGTAMCLQPCGHNAHDPQLPESHQPLSLNHYATGSFSECQAKAVRSQFNRDDRDDECKQLHPGTKAYRLLSKDEKVVQDPVMVKYAKATRVRRAELFHGAKREPATTTTTRHVALAAAHWENELSPIGTDSRPKGTMSSPPTSASDAASESAPKAIRPGAKEEIDKASLHRVFAGGGRAAIA